ncbi:hypothetical protein Y032_0003g1197 [Ancylostoma ceylanicum]|uniref:SCP domain-containing protein n=1 Tax=Ancylostoma ceylanicum TaxID=53326 RepID=A0A016VXG4_9BILA|nr:hypothetical protein Y032_0003g1197 [Ancylostoma ceylanicum]
MRLLLPLLGVGLLLVNVVITKPMKDAIKCPKKFDYKDYVYKFLYDLRNKRKLKPLKHDPAMDEEAGKVLKDFYYAEEKEYGYVRFQGIYKPKYWEKFLQKQKVEEEQMMHPNARRYGCAIIAAMIKHSRKDACSVTLVCLTDKRNE